jgi:hypothetical protein
VSNSVTLPRDTPRTVRRCSSTEHPTAEWTAQQFRMVMSGEEPHRFLHDHDSIYSDRVDRTIAAMGLTILKTVRSRRRRVLRTRDRHNSPRMLRLDDPLQRGSPAPSSGAVGRALQSRFILPHPLCA